jgi:dTDP-glucose pyrophosphorylase
MRSKKIKYGIIPAGGIGVRTGYLGKVLPKALFPIYDRPVIHHVVSQMERLGVKEVFILVNFQKKKIIDYFDQIKNVFRLKINFIEDKKPAGLPDLILQVKKYIEEEPFVIILGDDCSVTPSFKNLLDVFYKNKADVVEGIVVENNKEILKRTCCVKIDRRKRIIDIIEKPKNPKYLYRGCGVYVFNERGFDYLEKTPINQLNGRKEITDTVGLASKIGKGFGVPIDGKNININNYDDLLEANILMKESHNVRKK